MSLAIEGFASKVTSFAKHVYQEAVQTNRFSGELHHLANIGAGNLVVATRCITILSDNEYPDVFRGKIGAVAMDHLRHLREHVGVSKDDLRNQLQECYQGAIPPAGQVLLQSLERDIVFGRRPRKNYGGYYQTDPSEEVFIAVDLSLSKLTQASE